jgi:hypothetical protein
MDPSIIFAWIVGVLAALAVIGALAFAVVWEVCAIRRTLAQHRTASRFDPSTRYWRERGATVPTIPQRRKWS